LPQHAKTEFFIPGIKRVYQGNGLFRILVFQNARFLIARRIDSTYRPAARLRDPMRVGACIS